MPRSLEPRIRSSGPASTSCWRRVRRARAREPAVHEHGHVHRPGCGHDHGTTTRPTSRWSWATTIMTMTRTRTIGQRGSRPCRRAGAIALPRIDDARSRGPRSRSRYSSHDHGDGLDLKSCCRRSPRPRRGASHSSRPSPQCAFADAQDRLRGFTLEPGSRSQPYRRRTTTWYRTSPPRAQGRRPITAVFLRARARRVRPTCGLQGFRSTAAGAPRLAPPTAADRRSIRSLSADLRARSIRRSSTTGSATCLQSRGADIFRTKGVISIGGQARYVSPNGVLPDVRR